MKSRIRRDRKYRDVGLSPTTVIGVLRFIFAKARHLINMGRILRKSINVAIIAF